MKACIVVVNLKHLPQIHNIVWKVQNCSTSFLSCLNVGVVGGVIRLSEGGTFTNTGGVVANTGGVVAETGGVVAERHVY